MRLTDALLDALKANGARAIFGIPGDFVLPLFRLIEESQILPLYTFSHEPSAGIAADASGRVCGLGVVAVTYGAGALNLVNAVAAAEAERSPLVVISGAPGQEEARSGLLLHHQGRRLDTQMRIFSEITCAQTRLDDPSEAPAEIARVLSACKQQSRPVYIELPRDMPAVEIARVPPLVGVAVDEVAVERCATKVLERMRRATSPVMMVDVEVSRFGLQEKVAALARQLAVPVVDCCLGRGTLASSEAPFLGTYLGLAGDSEITRRVESSDGLLLLGVLPCDNNFAHGARPIDPGAVIHAFDGRVRVDGTTYEDVPLAALVDALLRKVDAPRRACAVEGPRYPRGLVPDDAPLSPADIAVAVNDLMAKRGLLPLAVDVGDCLFTSLEMDHADFLGSGYYASMGFAVPSGLAYQATTGQRPLILVGDGAFQMTGLELAHCARYGWDPIVVVFNNRGWGTLRRFLPEAGFNDLAEGDWAALAASLGGEGVRVSTRGALMAALDRAAARRGCFQLIEAMLPCDAQSATLQRFATAVRRLSAPASLVGDGTGLPPFAELWAAGSLDSTPVLGSVTRTATVN